MAPETMPPGGGENPSRHRRTPCKRFKKTVPLPLIKDAFDDNTASASMFDLHYSCQDRCPFRAVFGLRSDSVDCLIVPILLNVKDTVPTLCISSC